MATLNNRKMYSALISELPEECKVGHNTYAGKDSDGMFYVKLHSTRIVYVSEQGEVKLNSGGWRTTTTKDRMNKVLDFLYYRGKTKELYGVYQKNYQWYAAKVFEGITKMYEVEFFDGMVL